MRQRYVEAIARSTPASDRLSVRISGTELRQGQSPMYGKRSDVNKGNAGGEVTLRLKRLILSRFVGAAVVLGAPVFARPDCA